MLDGKRCPVCDAPFAYDPYYGSEPPSWIDGMCKKCYQKKTGRNYV